MFYDDRMKVSVVTGAGGFIGSNLVTYLKNMGHYVVGVDLHRPEFSESSADEFILADLRDWIAASQAIRYADELYALAADMGGMGFISRYHDQIMTNNTLINVNTLRAVRRVGIPKLFFSSSACVYNQALQDSSDAVLTEDDAVPADPQDGYGWEKLYMEFLCRYYSAADDNLVTKIARFHNCYGPGSDFESERAKAPAALCRKVAAAAEAFVVHNTEPVIDVWGDGQQVRSFMYIGDLLRAVYALMQSDYCHGPYNVGSTEAVTIDQLVHMIAAHAGLPVVIRHVTGPMGVRGRNSDNTRIYNDLGWEPQVTLADGIALLYDWVCEEGGYLDVGET